MVAAAGEGAGLSARVAWPVFLAVLAGIAAAFGMALRTSPLDRMRPEYTTDVLAQKARDAVRQLVSPERPRDEAAGFRWNEDLVKYVREHDKPALDWNTVLHAAPVAAGVLVPAEPRPADRRHVPQ